MPTPTPRALPPSLSVHSVHGFGYGINIGRKERETSHPEPVAGTKRAKTANSVEDIQEVRISALSSHKLVLDQTEICTTAYSFNNYRAQLIAQHVGELYPPGNCLGIIQHVRNHTDSVPDSDDEQIYDEEIPPSFTNTELPVVEACYKRLNSNFVSVSLMQRERCSFGL